MSGPSIVTKSPGSATIATGQLTTSSTAQLVGTTRPATGPGMRRRLTVVNTAATAVYLGPAGVTVSTGVLLAGVVGATLTLHTNADVYAVSGGTPVITFAEEVEG